MPRHRPRIAGRPVVVTGAASGIGRALAYRLSRLGSPVAIADVDGSGLQKTAASLSGAVLRRVLDVSDAADVVRFADEVRAWLPAPLGAVFNNAGVAVTSTILDAVPEDDGWLFGVNFWGLVHGTRAFPRILVGPDAYAIDALARIAPAHYDAVVARLRARLSRRSP